MGAERIAVFGGIYSNHLALRAAIQDAGRRGADALYCLGDLGAFGPNPDKVFPILMEKDVQAIRGNYDDSIARGLDDCQCGYTDPRDNHFARVSYRYTLENTSARWRDWMDRLPGQHRMELGDRRVLMCHGSPRRINEFLWESTTPTHFLEKLCDDHQADVILATHTGIPWTRQLPGGRLFVNVGALGRPANDGSARVRYAIIDGAEGDVRAQIVKLAYDHRSLAREMKQERLPTEFIETILTGWWTTCNEILPAKERACGKY